MDKYKNQREVYDRLFDNPYHNGDLSRMGLVNLLAALMNRLDTLEGRLNMWEETVLKKSVENQNDQQ